MDDPGRSPDPGPIRPAWFVGDLDDPWVAAIADALPPDTTRLDAPGDLPAAIDPAAAPGAVVLHRSVLTRPDAAWVARLRAGRAAPPRVVLCFGPHVRAADLERWSELVDAAVPEATARDTVARRLAGAEPFGAVVGRRPAVSRPRVAVVSTNPALRQVLCEGCEAAGYPVAAARDWPDAPPGGPAVWDVPVLEPRWPDELARRAAAGPVVALLGFADRRLVAEARARGASACLELPVDLADLAAALDRLPAPRPEPAHEVPPPPAGRRRTAAAAPAVADASRDA